MSKVTFRARQIDYNKLLTIISWDHPHPPDPNEYTSMLKTTSSMSTGMEKEEETEFHLQEVLGRGAKSVADIPVPDITPLWQLYSSLYPDNFVLPDTYFSTDASGWFDEEPVDYDIDDEDEEWIKDCVDFISPTTFEKLMDRFEKGCSNKGLSHHDALVLARPLQEVSPAQITFVYDYWLRKRVKRPSGLLFCLKQECQDSAGKSANDPYVAFRRRSEKMQTRKNRKNDELAYEKMFRLGQHLRYLQKIVQDVYLRESCKERLDRKEVELTQKYIENPNLLREHEIEISRSVRLSRSLYASNPLAGIANRKTVDNHSIYRKMWKMKDKCIKRKFNESSGQPFSDDSNIFDSSSDQEFEFVRKPGVQFERPKAEVSNLKPDSINVGEQDGYFDGAVGLPTGLSHGGRLRYGRKGRLILDQNCLSEPPAKRGLFSQRPHLFLPPFPFSHPKLYRSLSLLLPNLQATGAKGGDLYSIRAQNLQGSCTRSEGSSSRLHHCDSGTGSRPNSPENLLETSPERDPTPCSPGRPSVQQNSSDVSTSKTVKAQSASSDCDLPFVHSTKAPIPRLWGNVNAVGSLD